MRKNRITKKFKEYAEKINIRHYRPRYNQNNEDNSVSLLNLLIIMVINWFRFSYMILQEKKKKLDCFVYGTGRYLINEIQKSVK